MLLLRLKPLILSRVKSLLRSESGTHGIHLLGGKIGRLGKLLVRGIQLLGLLYRTLAQVMKAGEGCTEPISQYKIFTYRSYAFPSLFLVPLLCSPVHHSKHHQLFIL